MIKQGPFTFTGRKVADVLTPTAEFKESVHRFAEKVKAAKSILLSSTQTSDGDSVGAQVGLIDLMSRIRGATDGIHIINHTPVPHRYSFLKFTDKFLSIESKNLPAGPFDLGVTCDGGVERTGDVQGFLEKIPHQLIVDHHAFGSSLNYDVKVVDLDSSSTCEIVFHMFEELGFEVSKEVAAAIYVGIVFDTGFFKHSLTTPRTHLVAAKLVSTGIDFSEISDRSMLDRSKSAQKLLKILLGNMDLSKDGLVVSSWWTKEDLDRIGFQDGDQEGMINQLYYTEGIQVAVLFNDLADGTVKISFRSKGAFNVAAFARSLTPKGGGHERASGCTMDGTLSDVKALVFKRLESELK